MNKKLYFSIKWSENMVKSEQKQKKTETETDYRIVKWVSFFYVYQRF